MQQASDNMHQTTQLVIQPMPCTLYSSQSDCVDVAGGATVTINYKMRDKFKFLVGAGLTISNIVF
jgi:hypothetical protein